MERVARLLPIEQVGQVKVVDVVSGDDVRVALADEVGPLLEELVLRLAGDHVTPHDRAARVQGEHVPNEWLRLSLYLKVRIHCKRVLLQSVYTQPM